MRVALYARVSTSRQAQAKRSTSVNANGKILKIAEGKFLTLAQGLLL